MDSMIRWPEYAVKKGICSKKGLCHVHYQSNMTY